VEDECHDVHEVFLHLIVSLDCVKSNKDMEKKLLNSYGNTDNDDKIQLYN
jgi:hypothetical protein